jgi:hypothetical protein
MVASGQACAIVHDMHCMSGLRAESEFSRQNVKVILTRSNTPVGTIIFPAEPAKKWLSTFG